jgi:glutaredoxin-like protein
MGKIKLYGTEWCRDCRRSRKFLDGHGVDYEYIDIGKDSKAAKMVEEINKGNRSVPTIVFPDGRTLVEPSDEELGKALESL